MGEKHCFHVRSLRNFHRIRWFTHLQTTVSLGFAKFMVKLTDPFDQSILPARLSLVKIPIQYKFMVTKFNVTVSQI